MNRLEIARSRFYRRLEKFLMTVESLLVGGWVGFCIALISDSKAFGAVWGLGVFIIVHLYKRHIAREEK